MKSIEEIVFNRYISDQSLPIHKRMDVTCYIDWANLGAYEAQRDIPIEEEIPDETGWGKAPYIVKTKNGYQIAGFTEGWFHYKGGLCLKRGCVTHWRPLNRK